MQQHQQQINPMNKEPGRKGHIGIVNVTLPRERLLADHYQDDQYLLNQFDGVNDNPPEDGLPLRKWLLREARHAIEADHHTTEVVLKPKVDKSCRTQFCIEIPKE